MALGGHILRSRHVGGRVTKKESATVLVFTFLLLILFGIKAHAASLVCGPKTSVLDASVVREGDRG